VLIRCTQNLLFKRSDAVTPLWWERLRTYRRCFYPRVGLFEGKGSEESWEGNRTYSTTRGFHGTEWFAEWEGITGRGGEGCLFFTGNQGPEDFNVSMRGISQANLKEK